MPSTAWTARSPAAWPRSSQDATTFAAQAPTWGAMLAWGSLVCVYWPNQPTDAPKAISAPGSGPILVVGTTRDPATPYEWAVNLSKELSDGHLLTYDGDGHTAYRQGSSCVDTVVDDYLLHGERPGRRQALLTRLTGHGVRRGGGAGTLPGAEGRAPRTSTGRAARRCRTSWPRRSAATLTSPISNRGAVTQAERNADDIVLGGAGGDGRPARAPAGRRSSSAAA